MPTPLELARVAYAEYGESTGNKNYQGLPMPAWDDLPEPIRHAWIAAVHGVVRRLLTPPPAGGG